MLTSFIEWLAYLDHFTAWLRVASYLTVATVMIWRFMTDLTWPYFRLGLAIAFLASSITGFAVALENAELVSIMRTLTTPIMLFLAISSVFYLHQARRHRLAIMQEPLPPQPEHQE